jgi:hypothetical protein
MPALINIRFIIEDDEALENGALQESNLGTRCNPSKNLWGRLIGQAFSDTAGLTLP